MTALQIWDTMPTKDRVYLVDKYGKGLMPYELRKPTDKQIVSILLAARSDGYLIKSFKEDGTMKIQAELINYFDVWGNTKDGYEVNNLCSEGIVELPEEFNKKDILKALKDADFLKKHCRLNMFLIEDLYPYYEISFKRNGRPICRIEVKESNNENS